MVLVISDEPQQAMMASKSPDAARHTHLRPLSLQEDQLPESFCGPHAMSDSVMEKISGEFSKATLTCRLCVFII